MAGDRKEAAIGRYAIYFRTMTDTLKERRRRFFGRDADTLQSYDAPQESGAHQKSQRDQSEQEHDGAEKLDEALEKTRNILIKSTALFPFDPFPDTITIDRQKLTVVHRWFFWVKQTVSVQLSDIKNVQADLGPLFGSLTVTSEHFVNNTQTIHYLPRKEVLAIQQMVQGFIVAHEEGIDLSDIGDEQLKKKLDELGRGEAGERPVLE
jgi:hypothetical protein